MQYISTRTKIKSGQQLKNHGVVFLCFLIILTISSSDGLPEGEDESDINQVQTNQPTKPSSSTGTRPSWYILLNKKQYELGQKLENDQREHEKEKKLFLEMLDRLETKVNILTTELNELKSNKESSTASKTPSLEERLEIQESLTLKIGTV
jgi:hypothetical protein